MHRPAPQMQGLIELNYILSLARAACSCVHVHIFHPLIINSLIKALPGEAASSFYLGCLCLPALPPAGGDAQAGPARDTKVRVSCTLAPM